ncbi:histidine phosphatase family protein [Phyllobacterium myrsinacearum]|uniref:histidine phosphatase family protein n=1 Tax=Phyllobacterium myrsinacearum TaxID=28101 RepID=UPI0013EE5C23|nr:histidine phosphatase family protein [Phyllobacterium myrsinacearum]
MPPKDLKTFYIIRHGDTLKYSRNGQIVPAEKEINGVKHWYTQGGGNDNPLSKEGRAQAEALAPLIAKEPITKIWCSPASRAQETAKLANVRNIEMETDDNLKEVHYGKWEYDYAPVSVFTGEDPDTQDSGQYSANAMEGLKHCCEEGQAIFSHGNFLRTVGGALGVELSRADCGNAQLLRFAYEDGRWTVTNLSAIHATQETDI